MIPSNDSFNAFQYRLYWELQQSRLYTPIEDFPTINIIEPYLMSHFIGRIPFV